jgi:pyruvate/2-oxoglutarate dehydrogenase complex dihydrolipoamide dehydrogenase (E3) component
MRDCDICVIGAGSGGLVVAGGAAQAGARTILVEADRMGGECLNTGCVPSKALLAAAEVAAAGRSSARLGVRFASPTIDFAAVMDHVRGVIGTIAHHDSQERFEAWGVEVVRARARFVALDAVEAGGRIIHARRFVIATGSVPVIPPIPGLTDTPYLTNETLWELRALPDHLLVLGGGAIGCEMAQAFARLGAQVTLVEATRLLPRDDQDAVAVVRAALADDGVTILEGATVTAAAASAEGVALTLADGRRLAGSHLLVAAGRRAAVDRLGLEAAGVRVGKDGIVVDASLRTSNRRIFAVGDCRAGPRFTHAASQDAGVVIRRAVFGLPARIDRRALPWATFTDPELAQVGLTEAEARARHGAAVRVLRAAFASNDRALAERADAGFLKVVRAGGRVVGATIVGRHAGDLAPLWGQVVAGRLPLKAVADMVMPYPTRSEAGKWLATEPTLDLLRNPWVWRLVRLVQRLP